MTKYFCDRCGKESLMLNEIAIPHERTVRGSFITKSMQVCKDCEKEYVALNDKLVDIRFILFSDFMKGGRSNDQRKAD